MVKVCAVCESCETALQRILRTLLRFHRLYNKISNDFKAQRYSFGKSENLSKIFFSEILVLYAIYFAGFLFSRISRVGCYSRIYQHAKIFTSDPDAWMRLVYEYIALLDREFNHSRKCLKVPIREKLDSRNIWRIQYLIMIMKASHRAVMVCSESLFFFFFFFIWIIFRIVRRASEQIYTRYQLYFARCNYYKIVNLTSNNKI